MTYPHDKYGNYYDLFGVHSKAGPEEIRKAYRARLKEWHPDKNPDRKEDAEEMTKALNMAYYILSDPARRKNYDRMLRFSNGKNFDRYVDDEAFWRKVEKAAPSLNQILQNVRDLYSLFKDAVQRKYKLHPMSLGIIGGGLLYLIIPTDFIPDFIPFVGFLDDVAVLTTIIKALQGELLTYRNWKKGNESLN
jgi:curved DNA-binding protein CbpA